MKYTYGPWIAHNGDECPVSTDTMVRVWVAGSEKENSVWPANQYSWAGNNYKILVYQIATPVPEDVRGERVFNAVNKITGVMFSNPSAPCGNVRIVLPTINDKLVSCKCGQCRVEEL